MWHSWDGFNSTEEEDGNSHKCIPPVYGCLFVIWFCCFSCQKVKSPLLFNLLWKIQRCTSDNISFLSLGLKVLFNFYGFFFLIMLWPPFKHTGVSLLGNKDTMWREMPSWQVSRRSWTTQSQSGYQVTISAWVIPGETSGRNVHLSTNQFANSKNHEQKLSVLSHKVLG